MKKNQIKKGLVAGSLIGMIGLFAPIALAEEQGVATTGTSTIDTKESQTKTRTIDEKAAETKQTTETSSALQTKETEDKEALV